MIARRFLVYFLTGATFAVLITVVFEIVSLRQVADHAVSQHIVTARSVAQFVSGVVEHEARSARQLLRDLPRENDARALAARLRAFRKGMLDEAGVALIDDNRNVVASSLDAGGLPPPEVLLPALRQAERDGVPVATDLWWGANDKPLIALVVGDRPPGGVWRAAVLSVHLDGEDFLRLFGYFAGSDSARLQLLDSKGVAIYSTDHEERYRSAVHGTYFSDRVRLGKPSAMACHSCHHNGDSHPDREREITALAPVGGTNWSVTVREDRDTLFAPIREVAYSSVALVSAILGAFIGVFVLLSRRVLTPIRQLVRVATDIAQGDDMPQSLPDPDGRDELATLAYSLETIRRRARKSSETSRKEGGASSATLEKKIDSPQDELVVAMDSVLAGLIRIDHVCCAALLIEGDYLPRGILRSRGVTLSAEGPVEDALSRIGANRGTLIPQTLEGLGIRHDGCSGARVVIISHIHALETLRGQLWVGLSGPAEQMEPYLRPALDLVATQIQHFMLRSALYHRLRKEHEQKNRMLRHLFEAEDEERRRIAREIHDEPAQVLNALLVLLETFPDVTDPVQQRERIERAKSLVERTLDETDRLIRKLRPAVLDDLGLVPAVRAAGQNLLVASGVEFELKLKGAEDTTLPKSVEVAVYRVFQEAMTNIMRHSHATRCRARLVIRPDVLRASIEDDGEGMDLSWMDDPSARPRWGLLGMRERILQLGGNFHLSTAPGRGVRIELELPLPPGKPESGEA